MTRYGCAVVAAVLGAHACRLRHAVRFREGRLQVDKKLPPLEVPPDLTTPARDERYQIPEGSPTGTTTLSAYKAERSGAPRPGSTRYCLK